MKIYVTEIRQTVIDPTEARQALGQTKLSTSRLFDRLTNDNGQTLHFLEQEGAVVWDTTKRTITLEADTVG